MPIPERFSKMIEQLLEHDEHNSFLTSRLIEETLDDDQKEKLIEMYEAVFGYGTEDSL